MYNQGLHNSDLQSYHKSLKYSGNFFLSDILASGFFKTVEDGDFIKIYPLFYTDEIRTDWDNVYIDGTYMIIVPKGFKGLLTFIGNDEQVVKNKSYTIAKENGYYTIVIYNADTCEILPNQSFKIVYENFDEETYTTADNGYFTFMAQEDNFTVVVL